MDNCSGYRYVEQVGKRNSEALEENRDTVTVAGLGSKSETTSQRLPVVLGARSMRRLAPLGRSHLCQHFSQEPVRAFSPEGQS